MYRKREWERETATDRQLGRQTCRQRQRPEGEIYTDRDRKHSRKNKRGERKETGRRIHKHKESTKETERERQRKR